MNVIVFQDEAYRNLIKDLERMVNKAVTNTTKKDQVKVWLNEKEAKELLGVKSKSKMQQLRDDRLIVFSQHGRTIRYNHNSIIKFINGNIPKY